MPKGFLAEPDSEFGLPTEIDRVPGQNLTTYNDVWTLMGREASIPKGVCEKITEVM